MRRARGLIVAVFLALAPPAAADKVCVVVSTNQARAAAARAGRGVTVLAFEPARLTDPIEKGRFVAALQASDRIVASADARSCAWLGREVEGVAVHCVAPFDAGKILDFARAVGWTRIAVVHMTGHAKVYARLRDLGRPRGLELVPVRLEATRDLARELPRALGSAKAVWVLNDPLLIDGAAFDYLVEATVSRRIPLIGPDPALIARGAYLAAEFDPEASARYAVDAANLAASGAALPAAITDVPGGRLVINRVLARRWGLRVPGGAK